MLNDSLKKIEKYESLLKKEKEKVKHYQSIIVSSENIVKETFPKYWKEYHYIVVIDSNVLIDNHESFLNLLKPHAGIIIPNSVRGELNGLKKSNTIGYKARNALNIIDNDYKSKNPIIFIPHQKSLKEIINWGRPTTDYQESNDEEIVWTACYYKQKIKTREIVLTSRDTGNIFFLPPFFFIYQSGFFLPL